MPQFNSYSSDGRTLMVKFTCRRCGAEQTEPLKDCEKDPEHYGHLFRLTPPAGWKDLLHGPLLCADCYQKYLNFMEGKQ